MGKRYRFRDSMGVGARRSGDEMQTRLRESQNDQGNSRYILSLPSGDYVARDAGDQMEIIRGGDVICAVPAGSYRLESDDAGAHLYLLADDEPESAPLSDKPVRVGDRICGGHSLADINRVNAKFYGQERPPLEARPRSMRASTGDQIATLRAINQANKRMWNQNP